MVRWEPNARQRLEQAALELYSERGYEQATVAEIARRAGLTERTYFRHFADKREVLFGGSTLLRDTLVAALADAPATATPIEAIGAALEALPAVFQDRRPQVVLRQAIVAANPELQERELIKLASLSAALTEALTRRGTPSPAAELAAEAGVTVFRVAFQRWIAADDADMRTLIRESLAELKAVVTAAD